MEGLCVGTGLPLPKLYLVETEVPNAFSVGLTPAGSSVVVTRGLLCLLAPRELEGVLAHEISHIGNRDIRLSTMVAAMGAILRLSFRLLIAPIRFLFHVHWILGAGALLLFGHILLYIPFFALADFGESLRFSDEVDPTGNLRTLMLVGTGVFLYSFLFAPLIGFLFPLAISRQRELLADADAARLTLDPPSLARQSRLRKNRQSVRNLLNKDHDRHRDHQAQGCEGGGSDPRGASPGQGQKGPPSGPLVCHRHLWQ